MGIRPTFGLGVGLHQDNFPVWPEDIKLRSIFNPTKEQIQTAFNAGYDEWLQLTSIYELRKNIKSWDDDAYCFGRVFYWPDDEYNIPDWLVFPVNSGIYNDIALWGLASLYEDFWHNKFFPLPIRTEPQLLIRRSKETLWAIENNQTYRALTEDARLYVKTVQYLFREENIELDAKNLRLGVYMRWS